MNRVRDQRQREAIGEALTILGPIADRLTRVHILDCDPIAAGLHEDRTPTSSAWGGRSPRDTSHTCYPWHTSDGTVTIVLLGSEPPHVVVHELAHALDFMLDFRHVAAPTTWYGKINRAEAFAEAVTTRLFWNYGDEDALARDIPTLLLFDELLSA